MKSTKNITTIKQTADLLKSKRSFALFAHTNPDGDTVGASVALCLALQKIGKQVQIFCDGSLGDKLGSFEATSSISREFFGSYDLHVAVDSGDVFRLGELSSAFESSKETLTIDHHGGLCYSKYNCLFKYASTCQIVYEIIGCLGVEIDSQLATYLYMGLSTDTGNFAHANTDASSLLMGAELLGKGADSQRVIRVLLKDLTIPELKLRARVAGRLRTYYDDKLAVLYVTKRDLDDFGLDFYATTGMVQYAIDLDTSFVGVCICEHSKESYKISMRGKNFSVRKVCQEFGGGGHEFAAGCMISGMLEDVIEKVVRVVGFYI